MTFEPSEEDVDERVGIFELTLCLIPGLIGRGLHWVSDQGLWAWAGNGFFVLGALALVLVVIQAVRKGVVWGDIAGLAAALAAIAMLDWLDWWF
ncbi:hypothetical protein SMC26_39165 [Actinomadura fulvescens]